jgi:tRNA-2-methylthio-N6-dimethylallyladenosine synthase
MRSFQNRLSVKSKKTDIGIVLEMLIEGFSMKSADHFSVRPSQNKVVVFSGGDFSRRVYVRVLIERCASETPI